MFRIDLNAVAVLLIGIVCGFQLSRLLGNNVMLSQIVILLGIVGVIIKMILLDKAKRSVVVENGVRDLSDKTDGSGGSGGPDI